MRNAKLLSATVMCVALMLPIMSHEAQLETVKDKDVVHQVKSHEVHKIYHGDPKVHPGEPNLAAPPSGVTIPPSVDVKR